MLLLLIVIKKNHELRGDESRLSVSNNGPNGALHRWTTSTRASAPSRPPILRSGQDFIREPGERESEHLGRGPRISDGCGGGAKANKHRWSSMKMHELAW